METPLREHYLKTGKEKRAYTRKQALAEAKKHRKNAYQCRHCGKWHIGGRWKRKKYPRMKR